MFNLKKEIMGRSNFTPMKRFHEILDNYGLKLMEVGTNHLRVFFGSVGMNSVEIACKAYVLICKGMGL